MKVEGNTAKHIIPVLIAREVKVTIIFPASNSDKVALDVEGALQQGKEPPLSVTSLIVCIAFKGDINASACSIQLVRLPFPPPLPPPARRSLLNSDMHQARAELTQPNTRDIDIHGDHASHLGP